MKTHAPISAQPLPYPTDGLAPYGIPSNELEAHYKKHHCAYATQLEGIVAKDSSLCAIVDQQDFAARKMRVVVSRQQRRELQQNDEERRQSELKKKDSSSLAAASMVGGHSAPLTSAEALMLKATRNSHASNLASMIVNHDFFWKCWRGVGGMDSNSNDNDTIAQQQTSSSASSSSPRLTSSSSIVVGPETTSFSLRHKHPILSSLLTYVERDFGSVSSLMRTFERASLSLFGSGWVWLAWSREKGRLVVLTTRDSVNPLAVVTVHDCENKNDDGRGSLSDNPGCTTHGQAVSKASFIPLLGCDMWEHAFMTQQQQQQSSSSSFMDISTDREKRGYLRKFWSGANWEFAASNFAELMFAGGKGSPSIDGGIAGGNTNSEKAEGDRRAKPTVPLYNEKRRMAKM